MIIKEEYLMKKFPAAVLIGFWAMSFGFGSPQNSGGWTIPEIENKIQHEVTANNIPSVTAWVITRDSVFWEKQFGFADLSTGRKADGDTIYMVASVSKLIIVTAVMQLVESGRLDLDADIEDYLFFHLRNPNFPSEKITCRHLLTHTSGLAWPENENEIPGFYNRHPLDSAPALGEWLPPLILPGGSGDMSTVWKKTRPGQRELYSNIGSALLAYIVELATGLDFNLYCRLNIFEPLEMFDTSYAYADLDLSRMATLYVYPGQPIGPFRHKAYPAGSLKTRPADFVHFIMAYINRGLYKTVRILNPETVDEILKMHNPASGKCLMWNLSLGGWYGHSGASEGQGAYVEFHREAKIGLMIISNMCHESVYPRGSIHALVRRIANPLLRVSR